MDVVIEIAIGVLASIPVALFFDICTPASRALARRAAKKLPASVREFYIEQWLADIEGMGWQIGKLWFALGLSSASTNLLREGFAREPRDTATAKLVRAAYGTSFAGVRGTVDEQHLEGIVRGVTRVLKGLYSVGRGQFDQRVPTDLDFEVECRRLLEKLVEREAERKKGQR